MKIELFKVNVYQAYRADETGVRWFLYEPCDNVYYKCEILDEIEMELPKGITYDDRTMTFDDNGSDCQMVQDQDSYVYLVSANRMVQWFK